MTVPKLDGEEVLALAFSTLLSQLVFLLVSFFALAIADVLIAGNGFSSLATGGWASPVLNSLLAQPPLATLGIACASGFALFLYAVWSERRGLRDKGTRREIMASRQGVAGEMPRLPLPLTIVLMAIVGFSEELLFRFLLLGALFALLDPLCGFIPAACVSVAISSVAFCLAHVVNNGFGAVATWLLLGLVLGAVFVVAESLAAVAAAHMLYNVAVLLTERIEMRRDPDYFGGPIPTRVLMDSDDA